MSRVIFALGEFVFNMVKIWTAYDLIKKVSEPKRGTTVEKMVTLLVALVGSGVTTWNSCSFGFLFSNSMLWFVLLITVIFLPVIYHIRLLYGMTIIYLYWVTVHLVDFLVQSVVYYLLREFELPTGLFMQADWKRGLYLLLFSLVCAWVGVKLKQNMWLFEKIRSSKLAQLAGIIVATVLLVYFQRIYIYLVSEQYMTFWIIFLLASVILICVSVVYIQKTKMVERERIREVKLGLLEANYEQTTRMYKEKAILLHDEKHHMSAINELLKQGQVQRALQYTEDMVTELEKSGHRVWSDHSMLDLILNMKMEEARKKNIDVDIKFDDMSELTVDDVSLCALMSNLLDNAIEANRKMEAGKERWIKLYGERKGDLWIINSSNPIAEPVLVEEGRLLTSKTDKTGHGYGMESIRRVLDKYSGDMDVVVEPERFAVTLFMVGFQ